MDLVCVWAFYLCYLPSTTSAEQTKENRKNIYFLPECVIVRDSCVYLIHWFRLQCDMRTNVWNEYDFLSIKFVCIFTNENRSNCITERIQHWLPGWMRIFSVHLLKHIYCSKATGVAPFRTSVLFSTASRLPAPTDPESFHCAVFEWAWLFIKVNECARNAIYRNEKSFKCAEFRAPMIMNFFYSPIENRIPFHCVALSPNMETVEAEPFHSYVICYLSRNLANRIKMQKTNFEMCCTFVAVP